MAKPLYKIRGWSKTFERAQTRKQPTEMSWVPMPTTFEGKRYWTIARREDADRIFGCWMVMVEVAARRPLDRRGYLEDSDGPLDARDLHVMTGLPVESFELAFKVLTQKGIEWLLVIDYQSITTPAGCSGLQDKTRQDRTRHHNGGAFKPDCERFQAEYPKEISDYEMQIFLSEVRTQEQQDLLFENLGLYRKTDQWEIRKVFPSAKNWLLEGRWKVPPKSGAANPMPKPQRVYRCGECGDTGRVVVMDETDQLIEKPCPACGGKAAA